MFRISGNAIRHPFGRAGYPVLRIRAGCHQLPESSAVVADEVLERRRFVRELLTG